MAFAREGQSGSPAGRPDSYNPLTGLFRPVSERRHTIERLTTILILGCSILPGLAALAGLAALTGTARAAITVPSDGTDGAFSPAANTTVALGNAITGTWNTAQVVANRGKGIYDASQWAVVFKYSSVNIPAGVTVNFTNHPSRAPVVWLVQGNVTIAGTVNLDGADATDTGAGTAPGPGGFRGGFGGGTGIPPSAGLGPGGGLFVAQGTKASGSYASEGYLAPATAVYGNPAIVPLLGGSGGAGETTLRDGGAGGGAILIAATGCITLNGTIVARGGDGGSLGGSGGGVRLVADTLSGSGSITATGGTYSGGTGRVRVEANNAVLGGTINPAPSMVVPIGDTAAIWPAANAPKLVVTQVGGVNVPADPRGNYTPGSQDVSVISEAPVAVRLQATNVPTDWIVEVRLIPKSGPHTVATATLQSGTSASSVWQATVTLPHGLTAIQARARKP